MGARRIYLEYRAAVGRPRFYAARVRRVEGHWLVARHWGFVGCPGWHLSRVYASEAEAARALARLAARRERDGYRPATGPGAAKREQLVMPLEEL
jgi:predicted DNA-binding WGR domain protein